MCFFVHSDSVNGCVHTSCPCAKPLQRDSFRGDVNTVRHKQVVVSQQRSRFEDACVLRAEGASDFIRNCKYLIDQPGLVLQHNFTTTTQMCWLMLIKIINAIRGWTEERGRTAAFSRLAKGRRRTADELAPLSTFISACLIPVYITH